MRDGNYTTAGTPENAARAILRAVPLVMRTVRDEMRSRRAVPLSVPQFRALNFVGHHQGASLSDVATHVGVALPSMSRLVDGLVARKLVVRRGDAGDRRRLILRLTARGQAQVRAAHAFTEATIAARVADLDDGELAMITHAMELLQRMFAVSLAAAEAAPGNTRASPNAHGGQHV